MLHIKKCIPQRNSTLSIDSIHVGSDGSHILAGGIYTALTIKGLISE